MGKKKGGKAQKEAKKEAKAARNDAKNTKASKKRAGKDRKAEGNGEDDIDAILAELVKKDADRTSVTVTVVPRPGPRTNFSMTTLPSGELFLFGIDACGGRFFMATVLVFVAVPPFLFMITFLLMLTFFTMIFLMLALLTGDFLMIVATGSMIMTGFLMSIFLCLYKRKWGCKQRQCEY